MFGMLRKSRRADTARAEEEQMMDALRAHSTGWVGIANVQIGDRQYPRALLQQQTVRDCAGGNDVVLVDRGRDFTLWRCGVCGGHLAFEQAPRAKELVGGVRDGN